MEQEATTEEFSVVRQEGTRQVRRSIDHYVKHRGQEITPAPYAI